MQFLDKCQKRGHTSFFVCGYEPQRITYKGEKILAIKMLPNTELLDEVVVIGYGKQKKK